MAPSTRTTKKAGRKKASAGTTELADGATDDATDDADIGRTIRDLRRSKRITLEQLAQAAGTSTTHISQLERGLSSLSLSLLRRICAAMDVPTHWFFQGGAVGQGAEKGTVVRRGNRKQLTLPGNAMHDELLSPSFGGKMLATVAHIAPGGANENAPRDLEEFGILLEGQVEVWLDGEHVVLEQGDSLTYTNQRFKIVNNSGVAATMLWVCTPPNYS